MFSGFTSGEYQSVIFFVDGHVEREMMFSEFEAILDNFVPVPSYADKSIYAVCLGINGQLKIVSAIFFLLRFDSVGNADQKWNVPLQQLIEQSEPGPDLGAGPIKLCCRSQCPVEWHAQDLWDPDMSQQPNNFVLLRDLVRRNRLGFKELPLDVDDINELHAKTVLPPVLDSKAVAAPVMGVPGIVLPAEGELSDADKALAHSLIQYIRKKVIADNGEALQQLERQSQLQLAAQKTRLEDELKEREQFHAEELRQFQLHLQQMQELLDQDKQTAENLRRQLQDQQQMAEKMRENFHAQLAETKQVEGHHIETLKADFDAELELRMQNMAAEYEQQLDARDVEIAYRNEQLALLNEEISQMHEEHGRLIKEAGQQFISRLRDNKVTFMAYHPGAGNITIDLESIGNYLENPVGYAAAMCKVSESDYKTWLTHYNHPACCEYSAAKGEICGKKLRRVDTPSQFVPGRSDRCPLHWTFIAEATQH